MEFNQKMFGQRIQEARMSCGITIDISLSYYQKLERGVRTCSLDILVCIAEHLHVSTDYLLTGKWSNTDEMKKALMESSRLLQKLADSF